MLGVGQQDGAALEHVDQPAGRGDQHVDAAHQHVLLVGHALAADDQRVGQLQVLAVLHEILGDLQREFAGRLQDQAARHAGAGARAGQDVQHRQGEAGGLAGAGLRHAHHVAAHQHERDRLLLDRRRMAIAHVGDGAQHGLGQAEIGEGRARWLRDDGSGRCVDGRVVGRVRRGGRGFCQTGSSRLAGCGRCRNDRTYGDERLSERDWGDIKSARAKVKADNSRAARGITSPAGAGEVETRSVEGEGDRVAPLYLLRADPITLTLGASHHRPLPRSGRGLSFSDSPRHAPRATPARSARYPPARRTAAASLPGSRAPTPRPAPPDRPAAALPAGAAPPAQHPFDRTDHLQHRVTLAVAEIPRHAGLLQPVQRQQMRRRQVGHVHVVADTGAVAASRSRCRTPPPPAAGPARRRSPAGSGGSRDRGPRPSRPAGSAPAALK